MKKQELKELKEEKVVQVNNQGYLKLKVLPEDIVVKLDKLIMFINTIIIKNKLFKQIEDEDIFKEINNNDELKFLENVFKIKSEKKLFDVIKHLDNSVFIDDYLEYLNLKKNEINDCLERIDRIIDECRDYILDFIKFNKEAYLSEKTLLYAIAFNKYFWKNNYPVNLYYRTNKIYTYEDRNGNKLFENRLTVLFPKKLKEILKMVKN